MSVPHHPSTAPVAVPSTGPLVGGGAASSPVSQPDRVTLGQQLVVAAQDLQLAIHELAGERTTIHALEASSFLSAIDAAQSVTAARERARYSNAEARARLTEAEARVDAARVWWDTLRALLAP